jgi:lipopolysaccharide biosynthesis glycosyltransferase
MDDIAKLYDQDLGKYLFGAVPDQGVLDHHLRQLGAGGSHIYFNSGVLLMDAAKWRKSNMLGKYFKLQKDNRDRIQCPEQDTLNLMAAGNNYKRLDLRFNFQGYDMEPGRLEHLGLSAAGFAAERKSIAIRHFTVYKPWNTFINDKGQPMQNTREFWMFADMTPFRKDLEIMLLERTRANVVDVAERPAPFRKYWLMLFRIIPFIQVKVSPGKTLIKLFGILPIVQIRRKS